MADVVILGAGLTGISAAYHLEAAGYLDYCLFEKEPTTGGLCRSIEQDGFTFDYTGHLLHLNDQYVRSLLETFLSFDEFETITRRSYVYSQNVYTPYPYQINLHGLPLNTITRCIEKYVDRPRARKIRSFYDWVLVHFGEGFGDHFFFPYQEKIFAHDIKKVTASWTGRFVPATSLTQMLKGALTSPTQDPVGYNAQFYYPKKGGISFWVDRFARQLIQPVKTNYTVQAINALDKTILFSNGETVRYKKLITTLPLDTLLGMTYFGSCSLLNRAASKLLCNSVVNFNLGINRADLSDKHWIYFPEKAYPFYRLGFPHNFTLHNVPAGCSSLYGEFAYLKQSRAATQARLQDAIAAVKKLFKIDDGEIRTQCIVDIKHAYVIYDRWRDNHIQELIATLKTYDIFTAGRYGEWKYASMQEAVLDGKRVSQEILASTQQEGKKYEQSEQPSI